MCDANESYWYYNYMSYYYECYCYSGLWFVDPVYDSYMYAMCSTCPSGNYDVDGVTCLDDGYMCPGEWREYSWDSYLDCDPFFEDCGDLYDCYGYYGDYDDGCYFTGYGGYLTFDDVAYIVAEWYTCMDGYPST